MSSSVSSRFTSSTASVSELLRLVTHKAVSSPKCNSEKRPLSNSVAFRKLFKWHRYCSILKIHIIRKINTGIRYEPVHCPALLLVTTRSECLKMKKKATKQKNAWCNSHYFRCPIEWRERRAFRCHCLECLETAVMQDKTLISVAGYPELCCLRFLLIWQFTSQQKPKIWVCSRYNALISLTGQLIWWLPSNIKNSFLNVTVTRFEGQGRKDEEVRGDEPEKGCLITQNKQQ